VVLLPVSAGLCAVCRAGFAGMFVVPLFYLVCNPCSPFLYFRF
jgi:hypothetical protein